jgi:hypothetical protein
MLRLLVIGCAGAPIALALVEVLRHRVPLAVLLGGWLWLSLAGLVAGGAALLAAGFGRMRQTTTPTMLRLLFCSVVAGTAVHLAWLQPFRGLYALLTIGLSCSVFAGLLLARPVASGRALRALEIALFNLCLLAVLAELGLRAIAAWSPSPLLVPADGSTAERIAAHRLAPGAIRWGFPVNSRGYYDTEFRQRTQRQPPCVVAISDSFGVSAVPHHYHFTTVCERELGRGEIYNMGVASVGPREYLHLLRSEALALEPDLIVVSVFIGNDLGQAREATPSAGPLRVWLDRDRLRLWLLPHRLTALARERERGGARAEHGAGDARALASVAEIEAACPWVLDPAQEMPSFSRETFLDIEIRQASYVCAPGIAEAVRDLGEILLAMRRAAAGTPLVVLLLPDEFQVEDALWQEVTARTGPLDRDRPQRLLREWLEQHDFAHLDVLPLLRAVPPLADGRRHCYHAADTHFNARGSAVVGKALADVLARHLR